jgi:lysophospholipase L1-like esterase
LKPDVVSILIGINDCWRRYDSNDPMSTEEYKKNYHYILSEIKEKLNAQIILCEPFVLPVTEEQKKFWREDLDPKIQAVRELAREFNAIFIPFDGMFAAAAVKQAPEYWAADGVHPTQAGHALMSQKWLEAVGAIK